MKIFSSSEQVLAVVFSCHASINPTIKGSWIIEVNRKPYLPPSQWSDDMYIETIQIFENSHHGGPEQRSCSFWPAEALARN